MQYGIFISACHRTVIKFVLCLNMFNSFQPFAQADFLIGFLKKIEVEKLKIQYASYTLHGGTKRK